MKIDKDMPPFILDDAEDKIVDKKAPQNKIK